MAGFRRARLGGIGCHQPVRPRERTTAQTPERGVVYEVDHPPLQYVGRSSGSRRKARLFGCAPTGGEPGSSGFQLGQGLGRGCGLQCLNASLGGRQTAFHRRDDALEHLLGALGAGRAERALQIVHAHCDGRPEVSKKSGSGDPLKQLDRSAGQRKAGGLGGLRCSKNSGFDCRQLFSIGQFNCRPC